MTNAHTSFDSDPFLRIIDARLKALEQLRASYLAARDAGVIGGEGDMFALGKAMATPMPAPEAQAPVEVTGRAGRLPRGSIAAHVTAMVNDTTRPLRVKEIVTSLRSLGATSRSLSVTVHGVLNRLRHRGQVVRANGGWISHPDQVVAATTPAPPAAVRPRRVRRPRPKPTEPAKDQRPDGLAWRIESFLKSHGQPVAARYVADATGEPLNVVGLTLGRMVRQQRVERQADGHFAVVVPLASGHENGEGTVPNGQAN